MIEIFGADDAQACRRSACCGAGKGEARERGHDDGLGRFGSFGFAEQETDAGAFDVGGIGGWSLGNDDAWLSGRCEVRDCAEFEPEAANVDRSGALALTEDVGDGDLLCAETFGDADDPLPADGDAGERRLGEDVSGRGVGRVKAVFEIEDESEGAGLFAGVGKCEAAEVGNFDLSPMNGETHGDERREERDHHHGKGAKNDVEESVDPGDPHCSVRIYGGDCSECMFN